MKMRIPVVSPTEDTTHIALSVYRMSSGAKPVVLSVSPIEITDDGFCKGILMRGRLVKLADMPRFSHKKIAELEAQVSKEIEAKSGPAWDLVQSVCAASGTEVA